MAGQKRPASGARDSKKKLILDAARGLLVSRGYQDFALDDVAEKAGVAKGTLFLYFRSKDELFAAVFADLVDSLGAELDALRAGGLGGRLLLERLVGAILAHFERNRDFMAHFAAGKFPACGDRSCSRLMERMSGNIKRVAALLSACGPLLSASGRDFAPFALFGLCRSATFAELLDGRKRGRASKTRLVVEFFLHGAGR